jgi:hypothetical protein
LEYLSDVYENKIERAILKVRDRVQLNTGPICISLKTGLVLSDVVQYPGVGREPRDSRPTSGLQPDDVDLTLIRRTLSVTPQERMQFLEAIPCGTVDQLHS